ncbi:MAG: DUF58 domain-containing protein [Jatrophihabitans sp.]|uniref:DUF58 domain-containing protein n=1 Tax=Jatrophihabitans sp. TaxID=1932789 RepID=UPI003F7EC6C3
MTFYGLAALVAGIVSLVLGLSFDWLTFDLVGLGLLAAVVLAFGVVSRPSPLQIDREIQPPRVPKGSPAIAFLTFANRGRRSVATTVATQPFGGRDVRTVIPRLRRGERGSRAYRLPTSRRGIFDVPPLEVTRRDAYEFFRTARTFADVERIWVYPRILPLRRLSSGQMRHLEGPSSDVAPQGNITFHRLRDYVAGDDLRLVHWRSSARTGRLVVRHNVDTSQPYSAVIFDQRPNRYTEESFEQAVDVVASVVTSASADKAPVELRLTDGTVVGGARLREPTPIIDHLTGVGPDPDGSLQAQLLLERRGKGGTSLVVVTGVLDPDDLPAMAALRRRFDRLVLVSIDVTAPPPPHFPGVRVISARDADEAAQAWNLLAAQP